MKTHYLLAALFLLTLSTPAFSQQNFVLQDDTNEPCRMFKMRVLIPVNTVGKREVNVAASAESVDRKMVWNPCPRISTNVAKVHVEPSLQNGNNYVLFEFDKLERRLEFLRPKSGAPAFWVKPRSQP
jgi:hypothetical protein